MDNSHNFDLKSYIIVLDTILSSYMSNKAENRIETKWTNERGIDRAPTRAEKNFLDVKIDFIEKDFVKSWTVFKTKKDKERYDFHAKGFPPRVLDAILNQVPADYYQDIIDFYSQKKLQFMQRNIRQYTPADIKNELATGFALERKIKGKKKPELFKPDEDYIVPEFLEKELFDAKEQDEKKINPFLFKSAATKQVIDLGIYEHLTPAEILTQRINLTGASVPQIAKALRFDVSTVYHHVKGTREVDRKAALRYASFFNCNPADILFPPIKLPVSGTVNFLKQVGHVKPCEVEIKYQKQETVLCPRDFYQGIPSETKAIKINSPSSVYDGHVAYYYFTNKKEADCENKICFIGVDNGLTLLEGHQDYYIGIYENYRGDVKILNPDPYRKKEVILDNPKISFIAPIIGMVNIDKVKFSPVQEIEMKKLSENQKLKKLEKDLELSEQNWWIQNQKLSGKSVTSPSKVKELEKMYKELREQRLEVDRMRRSVQESIDKNASDLDRRLNKFFENAVKELNEKNKKQIYELDKKLNTNKRA